jgi:hypothetical protein
MDLWYMQAKIYDGKSHDWSQKYSFGAYPSLLHDLWEEIYDTEIFEVASG